MNTYDWIDGLFIAFSLASVALFYMGSAIFSNRFKRPFLYFEIKALAAKGSRLAQAFIWGIHLSILFSVLLFCLGVMRFF
jgi:hypothetical protein